MQQLVIPYIKLSDYNHWYSEQLGLYSEQNS